MAEHWTDSISDDHLRCIVFNLRSLTKRSESTTPAWGVLSKLYGVGSTTAAALCRRAGIDPDAQWREVKRG